MAKFIDRTGETNIAKNGLKMTIIEYINADNITIQFEDNKIVTHKKYENFKKGYIKHPTISGNHLVQTHTSRQTRLGITKMMNCGMECTIIEIPDKHLYVVQFTDGTIRHGTWKQFNNGNILNPNCIEYVNTLNPIRLHEKHQTNSGLTCTITQYICKNDVNIQFEDGRTRTHVKYRYVKNGKIAPPKIINNITIGPFAYIYDDNWYYECSHPNWTEHRILSVQEIYDYQHEVS